MKLRTQIIGLGLAGALAATVTGLFGMLGTHGLGAAIDDAIRAGQALQASQEADMMHDAVRGDAQLALLGALQQRPERIAEAERGLQDHRKTFDAALQQLGTLPLPPDSAAALAAAQPLVQRYVADAAQVIRLAAGTDAAAQQRAAEALQASFTELEARMATLSDSIERHGEALNADSQARVDRTRGAIVAALLAATAAMLALAGWLARRMTQPMAQAVALAHRLAEGDLRATVQAAGNDENRQLLQALARMRDGFADIVRTVQANAAEVANASAQIAQGNQELSNRTEQQAGALQQTASTMNQLGSSVRHNADNAQQANQLARGASDVAGQGGQVMGEVVTTMSGINDSAHRIADIIGLIDGIAFQTNILALNAAVEAARAGEQGRGFAVVAGEVRALAQRSAAAAREVKALVGTSVERVEQGTRLVEQAGQTMAQIVDAIRRVSDIVAEISAASAEQSAGVGQVGQAVAGMDGSTQQNAALVEQSAAAAATLSEQAQQLVRAVAAFRLAEAGAAG